VTKFLIALIITSAVVILVIGVLNYSTYNGKNNDKKENQL
jgi:hypothetical protein